MSSQNPPIRLLQAEIDEGGESYYRFLYNGQFVKYINIATGIYNIDDLVFEPTLVPLLPTFPPGDWNIGFIDLEPATKKPYFLKVKKATLPGVESVWHPTRVSFLEFTHTKKTRSRIYEATCARFDSPVILKFAHFGWEIDDLEKVTMIYQLIEGQDIGPRFLGHLTEEGRVIGIILEKIPSVRRVSAQDIELCRISLSKLHGLGIVHGDTNKHNFVIARHGAVLVDFERARRSDDSFDFEQERQRLLADLSTSSTVGGNHLVTEPYD